MHCRNHEQVPATCRCTGCAEPFCAECSLEVRGQPYCGDCKMMALEGKPVAALLDDEPNVQFCGLAWDALKHALIGFMCCGFVMGPAAVLKALTAKREIESTRGMYGMGVANAAFVIGTVQTVYWLLGLVLRSAAHR